MSVEVVLEKRSRLGVWWSLHFTPEPTPGSLVPPGATETHSRWARSKKAALRRARRALARTEQTRLCPASGCHRPGVTGHLIYSWCAEHATPQNGYGRVSELEAVIKAHDALGGRLADAVGHLSQCLRFSSSPLDEIQGVKADVVDFLRAYVADYPGTELLGLATYDRKGDPA